jgi:hypothetical protein
MILSILSVKPANDKEKNNNDEVTLSAIKMKWNNKQKNIARASTWSTNLIMKKDCKANKDDKIDCESLPEKYKFQGTNTWNKAEVHIVSGTLGMEFFLERTLPEFNQAGTRLDWSWSKSFSKFENVLCDGYCTTWLEVLTDHFPEPLENEPKATRELNSLSAMDGHDHPLLN